MRFQPPQVDDSETEERDPPEPMTFDFLGIHPLLGTIAARRMGG